MIGIENKDSSFFSIESNDIALNNKNFEKNVLSISITEKESAMPQGSLSFYDPDDWFSGILRTGINLKISWGYKKSGLSIDSLLSKKLNLDEVSGSLIRRGMEAIISSPSGEGSQDGRKIFNCNFTALGFRGIDQSKIFTTGKKKDIINNSFDDLKIKTKYINFSLGDDSLNIDTGVRQDEPTFAFLNRLAKEWRCLFHVGFSPLGNTVGIFVDANKIGDSVYTSLLHNATGSSNIIGYKGELNNVLSYTWSSSESESGIGDNTRLDIIDGQIVYRRFEAKEEQTITYRLDIKKIQEVYKNVDDLTSQLNITKELLSKKTFEQIKHFFTPIKSTTAPAGYGYRIQCNMIGNPLFSPPNQIKINNGFPERLGGSQSKWYCQSVTHNIDKSGYNMNAEIVDVFTLSPIGLAVR